MDQYQDLRSERVKNLEKRGIKIEVHHHEVGTAGLRPRPHEFALYFDI
jgi:glutamine synthetase